MRTRPVSVVTSLHAVSFVSIHLSPLHRTWQSSKRRLSKRSARLIRKRRPRDARSPRRMSMHPRATPRMVPEDDSASASHLDEAQRRGAAVSATPQ
ncbi:hypothetical protein FA95DRAFT_1613359 [Auriscalpium vulgare]|uniref:Uncharacterized protein n=1 Tax=Auriscalpium vulgare TaxID=40419 RepID=A0ACB8R2Z4_9AGAM|nr:hypothetical protein FA95DRAFT_1613359 [Auriscalpium vulgare]